MSARAFRATTPAGIATVVLSCAALSGLIVFWGFEASGAIWGLIALGALMLLALWPVAWSGSISLERMDQFAWALLLCHTLQFVPGRDPGILVQDQTPTSIIVFQVVIWSACLIYAGARLIGRLERLGNLWGAGTRYATIFFVMALCSTLYSASPLITLAWSVKLGVILTVVTNLFDARQPAASVGRFLQATFAGLALTLVLFLVLGSFDPEAAVDQSGLTGIWRLGGFLLSASKLSAVAGMVAVLALIEILSRRAATGMKLILVVAIAMMLASLGRGGMLAAAVSMCLVLIMFRRMKHAAALVCVVGLMFLIAPGLLRFSWDTLSRGQGFEQIASLTGRIPLWETVVELIHERPLLGWGYVSGSRVVLVSAFKLWPAVDAHNALLQLLLTLGVTGAAVMLGLLWKTVYRAFNLLRLTWRAPELSRLGRFSLTSMALSLFLIVQGLFEGGFAGAPKFETAILIGCAMSVDYLVKAAGETA